MFRGWLQVLLLMLHCANNVLEGASEETTPKRPLPPFNLNIDYKLNQNNLQSVSYCSDPEFSDVILLLYRKLHRTTGIPLNAENYILINSNKKLIILIHGWFGSEKSYGIQELKDAYLNRYDCNTIIVNWKNSATQLYPLSVCMLPKVALLVAKYLCFLRRKHKILFEGIHLVGHSLGGQMAGFISNHCKSVCGKQIGRITALDPAGPLYQGFPESQRLDQEDARFVDVIHTNQGYLGYWGNCGDIDYYVNCGSIQPGCEHMIMDAKEITFEEMQAVAYCDHFRSVELMVESVNTIRFKARYCPLCTNFCFPGILTDNIITSMGENCPENATKGGYYITTNSDHPYAKG